MSSPHTLAAAFALTPAICRAEYPLAGGNHILHVTETESGESRDGYIARRARDGATYYITRNEYGWSAQRMRAGVASNVYWRTAYPTRTTLLASI